MAKTDTTTSDRIAMLLGGGLILFGIVVLGFLNVITNNPHMPVVEEGEVIAEPLVSADLRAYLIALGLLVWAAFGVYRLTRPVGEAADKQRGTTAD